jgi:hypothetical protein
MSIGFSREELHERMEDAMDDQGMSDYDKRRVSNELAVTIALISLNNLRIEEDLKRIGLIPETH